MTEISSQKQKPWQFQKGRPGNPAGKPKGTRSAITLAAEVQLDGEAEAPARKCINLAMKGDAVALCPCIERIAPAAEVPARGAGYSPIPKSEDLIPAFASVLEGKRHAIEQVDIEKRLAAVEARSAAHGK